MKGGRIHRWRDGLVVALVALAVRLAVVLWAAKRFLPAGDGHYYHIVAERISRGLGYTWLWPDGAVTYAAHYPVGYPAMIGGLYALFGPHPWVAMTVNAVLGAATALACYWLALRVTSARGARIVGFLSAFHVALVPYVVALMTELATGAAWTFAVLLVQKARSCGSANGSGNGGNAGVVGGSSVAVGVTGTWAFWALLLGVVLGCATLFRAQSALLIVPFAWLCTYPKHTTAKRAAAAAGVVAVCFAVFFPWIVRNYLRLGEFGLSFNGGWNLLIGTDRSAGGTFATLKVPPACMHVFHEAQKDLCFAAQARANIAQDPLGWLGLVPKKLGATFNYCGAAGWYLHESNAEAFTQRAKLALGAVETLYVRVVLLMALVGVARRSGPCRRWRIAVGVVSTVALFTVHGWVGVLGLVVALVSFGRELLKMPVLVVSTVVVMLVMLATHGVFFGAGRYSLVVFPLLTVLAGIGIGDTRRSMLSGGASRGARQET